MLRRTIEFPRLSDAAPMKLLDSTSQIRWYNVYMIMLAVTQGRVSLQVTPDAQKTVAWEVHP